MWVILWLLVLLVGLSVYSAFIGAQDAKELFNSIPLQIFWLALFLSLIISITAIPQLRKNTPLLLIHIGALLVLAGGMWSSKTGHQIQRRLFKNDKYEAGKIMVEKGKMQNLTSLENYIGLIELPFSLALEEFTIEYYDAKPDRADMRMPKGFYSDIKVIENDKVAASKRIAVNRPLHYGGYYFLQYDWGYRDSNPYTVLSVVSDSGIGLVFGGYIFLCVGVFQQLWSRAFKRT
jgi:hypothetical protein